MIVSLGITVVSLVTPVLVQQVFDHGFTPGSSPRFVYGICAAAFLLVIVAFLAGAGGRAPARARVRGGLDEPSGADVRAHPPALDRRAVRGEARRVRGAGDRRRDSLQQFTEWGGIAWIVSFVQASARSR